MPTASAGSSRITFVSTIRGRRWRTDFVHSLAAQLAEHCPRIGHGRFDPMRRSRLAAAADDPGSAFEAAILNPFAGLAVPRAARLIVVDALDESLELEEAETKHGTLVRLLAEKVPTLPSLVRTLITARNNPAVIDRLKFAFAPKEIDAEAHLNLQDIHDYVLGALSDRWRRRWPPNACWRRISPIGCATRAAGSSCTHSARSTMSSWTSRSWRTGLLPLGMDGFYSEHSSDGSNVRDATTNRPESF